VREHRAKQKIVAKKQGEFVIQSREKGLYLQVRKGRGLARHPLLKATSDKKNEGRSRWEEGRGIREGFVAQRHTGHGGRGGEGGIRVEKQEGNALEKQAGRGPGTSAALKKSIRKFWEEGRVRAERERVKSLGKKPFPQGGIGGVLAEGSSGISGGEKEVQTKSKGNRT